MGINLINYLKYCAIPIVLCKTVQMDTNELLNANNVLFCYHQYTSIMCIYMKASGCVASAWMILYKLHYTALHTSTPPNNIIQANIHPASKTKQWRCKFP